MFQRTEMMTPGPPREESAAGDAARHDSRLAAFLDWFTNLKADRRERVLERMQEVQQAFERTQPDDDWVDPNRVNIDAFQRDREALLAKHAGEYVVYHEGKPILFGKDEDKVTEQAFSDPNVRLIMVQPVVPEEEDETATFSGPRFAGCD